MVSFSWDRWLVRAPDLRRWHESVLPTGRPRLHRPSAGWRRRPVVCGV